MTAPRRCPRCGADVPAVHDLAVTALHARRTLDRARLALPGDDVARALRALASALACIASLCPPTLPGDAA